VSESQPEVWPPGQNIAWPTLGVAVGLIVAAGVLAYRNTFAVPFVLDDTISIVDNPTLRSLWPPWAPLLTPHGGETTAGRPFLNLSLALNYAGGGLAVRGYHALNLALHLAAGLTLLGVLRRSLPRIVRSLPASESFLLATAIALLWTVHPLQTQAVTYIVQRAESQMGLCYLLALYGFVRSCDSPRPARWRAVSWAACVGAMGTKEVAVSLPIVVLLFDRTFVAGSFRAAWQARRRYYLALAATWSVLAFSLLWTGGNRGGSMGPGVGVAFADYWLTQFRAVSTYLRLTVWPDPLVFEYGRFLETDLAAVAPHAALVCALLAATAVALWRGHALGFLGACFFAILAPSSLMPSTSQMIVEHRMYLPLAACLTALAGVVRHLAGRRTPWLLALGAAVLVPVTHSRNEDYATEKGLWADTLAKRPDNARALDNYALALCLDGAPERALPLLQRALAQNPDSAPTRATLGMTHLMLNRLADAEQHLREAVAIDPKWATPRSNLGLVLLRTDRYPAAVEQFQAALQLGPETPEARWNLGNALAATGDLAAARPQLQRALQLAPSHLGIRNSLATLLTMIDALPEAVALDREALRLNPDQPRVLVRLALTLLRQGDVGGAADAAQRAAALDSGNPDAAYALGLVGNRRGDNAAALRHFETAIRLQPGHGPATAALQELRAVRP
jgi:Flp pilus assembly protein TadD